MSLFVRMIGIVSALLFSAQFAAASGDLSTQETASGLKEALVRGANVAVSQLGKPNGFLGDSRVRIPLPDSLRAAEKMMRTLGMKKEADELIETMNRAAESAVVEAKPILLDAVRQMGFDDARGILTGGDDAATQYFKRRTSAPIAQKFLPIVKQATAKVNLADQYNQYAGQAAKFGLVKERDANIDNYVTQKALDGLFLVIADQEKAIRKDPIGTGSKLLQTVFGSLGK
ncbi:MAG TPA: DUF4197 domain-containing protein [Accumulibacter sp.]|nr:DUF4197 domain-containing protein [Accumulibacter sp.]HND79941.1 DUF4197 domain-containing protein [Accumulibacter sp.]HNG38471.1 DUF4197 domain-containing protein [Accumulibacter sp.]HNH24993.1 DUF4197 domain-containing protein [Accumulibacter sp.]HNI73064.1 DUF4197 domain-containing protein [Accumulibacter sp.]